MDKANVTAQYEPRFGSRLLSNQFLAPIVQEPAKLLVLGGALLILAAAVGYPLYLVFKYSFVAPDGSLNVENFAALIEQRGIVAAAWNSFLLTVFVPLGCLAIGIPLAYLVSRTNMPGKNLIRAGAAAAFMIPSYITVITWVFLAAPNSGQLNWLVETVFGAERFFNIYSFGGLVFVEVAHFFPIVFFSVAAALDSMDGSFEQAARILGAGRLRTAASITIPLVGPAIVASSMLCAIDALAAFGAPAAIGVPANFSVITIKIYQLIVSPPRLELAAALSLPVIAFTFGCLYLQRRYLRRNRFRTVGGVAAVVKAIDLGRWRWPLFAVSFSVCIVTVILPVCGLIALSLLTTYGASVSLENFTLANYSILFDTSTTTMGSFYNSFVLAVGAAFVCGILGVLYVWMVDRTAMPGRGLITGFIMIIYGLPPMALGIGMILAYSNILYGTLGILLLGYVAKHLPLAFVVIRNTVKQITPELEEAARVCGASWLRAMWDITIPLLKPGLLVAWTLVFAYSLRELPLSVLLVQPGTEVLSVSVLNMIETGFLESAAAVSVLIVAFGIASMALARAIAGRSIMEVR